MPNLLLLLVAGQGVGVLCYFLLPAGHLVVANNRAVLTLSLESYTLLFTNFLGGSGPMSWLGTPETLLCAWGCRAGPDPQ